MQRYLRLRQPLVLVVAAAGIRPAADAAKEMELTGRKPGFRLDALRQGAGETIAAFQHDNVSPGGTHGRTHDLKGDVADLDRGRLPEQASFVSHGLDN